MEHHNCRTSTWFNSYIESLSLKKLLTFYNHWGCSYHKNQTYKIKVLTLIVSILRSTWVTSTLTIG